MSDFSTSNQPFPSEAVPARSGCAKAALFGCGGLLVLLLVAVGIFLFKIREITVWTFGVMEQQIMARLPPGTSDEDALRIRRGFDGVVEAIFDDTVDPQALQQLRPVVLRFADPQKSPRPEDVERLIELLEQASGLPPPPALPEGVSERSAPQPGLSA